VAKTFLTLGMAKGPLLAYLLADPVISLPSILVVRKIMEQENLRVCSFNNDILHDFRLDLWFFVGCFRNGSDSKTRDI